MQLVFTVYDIYCHFMLSDLQDTTKNLKTLDHMLDNYQDVSRNQRSTNDRVSLESFPLKYPFISRFKRKCCHTLFCFFFHLFLSRGFLLSYLFFVCSNFLHVAIFLHRKSLFIVCTVYSWL